MKELIERLKKKEEALRDSIARVRGLFELDKDKVKADERMLAELRGRLMEVQQLLKEFEERNKELSK